MVLLPVSAPSASVSNVPTYGSMAAGVDHLLRGESAYVPRNILTKPGVIKGFWTEPGKPEWLTISETYTNRAEAEKMVPSISFIEDVFTLNIGSGNKKHQLRFEAAYGAFRVYGVNVDRDDVEEIVLERGQGRGTFVYTQKLEIFIVTGSGIEEVFDADLNGYISDPDRMDPVSWERAYIWTKPRQNDGLDLELRLIPPPMIPKFCGSESTLFVLQHPKLRFGFNSEQKRFEIVEEVFAPLGKKRATEIQHPSRVGSAIPHR